jgi:hypothetical protein
MTKESAWRAICRRNPRFEVDGAHFTARGLRQFFDRVWDAASDDRSAVPPVDGIEEVLWRMFRN